MSHPHPHPHPHHPDHDRAHREEHGPAHGHHHLVPGRAAAAACCGAVPAPAPDPDPAAVKAGALVLRVPAMDCPAEEGLIRAALERVAGIRRLDVDLPGRTLVVDAPPPAWAAVQAALQAAGFPSQALSAPPPAAEGLGAQRRARVQLAAALVLAVAAEALDVLAPHTPLWRGLGLVLAVLAIGLSGLGVFRKGLAALARADLNIHALMSVAVTGAVAIGQWPEAAMVMALYTLAELIEAAAVVRARQAIAGLMALSPAQAEVRQPDGQWLQVPAAQVPLGATVRVRPGERLALDGRVSAGRSAVDQAPVTGESLPVDKGPGDMVYAGTINQGGALTFEVTRLAGDTELARIVQAVEQAQGQRAPTQRFIDRFAAVYTPLVFVLAVAVAVGTPLLLGWPWLSGLYKALVLLVIACPCALVIATPVTVVSGLAAAARRGVVIKGGVFLEGARRLQVVALDKTGTLTEGRPRLVAQAALAAGPDDAAVWRTARSLALRSDHPVARAVAGGLDAEAVPVDGFAAEPGRGVHGTLDGRHYSLGNHRWMHERGLCPPGLEARLQAEQDQGRTVTLLADDQRVLALFAVADTVKPGSREAVARLKALGVRPLMLTGDNPSTARAIALQVGIDEVRAELLPQDKLAVVQALVRDGLAVGMVGDGINDAPSLAAAAIGFSMGAAGTDTAREAADVLIMNDDLRRVPDTIALSRRTHAVLWQNIALALGIKLLFLVLAVFGSASMWMAVFADLGATLLVVGHGLRLGWRPATRP